MKKKIITGSIAAFVGVVAIIAFTIEAKAVWFCEKGDIGTCLPTPDEAPAFDCFLVVGIKDCSGVYDKPMVFVDAGRL